MLTGQLKVVGSQPGTTGAEERVETLTDEQLLDWFLNRDDGSAEEAFRAIVLRHGPMVLGVCRHILNQHQDAEDAFQATFLVLARKGGSIRDRRVLARWLYEVAYRIAMRARTNGVRRRTHERQGGEMAATVTNDNHGWVELRPVLHEEVNRLPEKYRLPVILCYLEGKTNEEVAEQLKWPVGTVKGRLSRARDLLRSRLSRRGLALSAAFLVTALGNGTVIAEVVPPRLVDETVSNALVDLRPKHGRSGRDRDRVGDSRRGGPVDGLRRGGAGRIQAGDGRGAARGDRGCSAQRRHLLGNLRDRRQCPVVPDVADHGIIRRRRCCPRPRPPAGSCHADAGASPRRATPERARTGLLSPAANAAYPRSRGRPGIEPGRPRFV